MVMKDRILYAGNCYCPYCLGEMNCSSKECKSCGANVMQPIICKNIEG